MRREMADSYRQQITSQIAGSERALDLGLIANLRMSASMLEARLGMGMGAAVKNELVQRVGGMIASDLQRRNELIEVHAELAALGRRMGLDVTATGDGGDKAEDDVFFPLFPAANDGSQTICDQRKTV